MLLNYIKIILRNLYKEKLYALINISGLSLGIACCIILGLFLRSELTYDRHHLKHKRIFRIVNEASSNDILRRSARTSDIMGPLMARDYAEIETCVRFRYIENALLRHEDDAFYWENVYLADKSVFEVFTHEYIYGDPKTALSDPSSMAVSESFAKKYFGDANPIGKTITNVNDYEYRITLVFADLPENTHLKYDVLFSYTQVDLSMENETIFNRLTSAPSCYTYLLMPEGYQAKSFQGVWKSFFNRYLEERTRDRVNWSRNTWLEPLADIHLKSDLPHDRPRGNKFQVYGLLAVGVFILIVACINYINLATARSMKRGREVGVRKVFGATRRQLIAQFLGESVFFSLIALVIGIVLVETALAFTPINDLLGKQELIDFSNEPALLLWMLSLSLVIGLISGIYPAFYHSSIFPISALTGRSHVGKKGFRVRQLLVLVQFVISIGVITATTLIAIQMHFVDNIDLGFNKENRVITNLIGADLHEKVPILKTKLLSDSRILGVSLVYQLQGHDMGEDYIVDIEDYRFPVEDNDGMMVSAMLNLIQVDEDFIKVLGSKIKSGRDFSKRLSTDVARSCLVNEATVKMMGWVEPLDKRIGESGGYYDSRVVGVVEDFNFHSLHHQVDPLVIYLLQDDFSTIESRFRNYIRSKIVINISGKEVAETLNYIKDVFEEFDTKHPFEHEFLSDIIDQDYRSEKRLMGLIGILSGISIFISCLGLFGLAAFSTEQRTKEIGIRKVLGATTFQIIVMLSRNILFIVLVASIIASLAAYLVIDEWLADFAYHAGINPLVFVLSAAFAMALAFGTVALQSFRTARANPVKALRYE